MPPAPCPQAYRLGLGDQEAQPVVTVGVRGHALVRVKLFYNGKIFEEGAILTDSARCASPVPRGTGLRVCVFLRRRQTDTGQLGKAKVKGERGRGRGEENTFPPPLRPVW